MDIRMSTSLKHRYNQRLKLELELETIPRDSKYSNNLIEMMKKEEMMISKQVDADTYRLTSKRIDEGLKAETMEFFDECSRQNIEKWLHLKSKLDQEQLKLMTNRSTINGSVTTLHNLPCALDLDLDLETKRLELDYNQNWKRYEEFHLLEAFKAQLCRIESEWASHEVSELQEYNKIKSKLSGELTPLVQSHGQIDQSSSDIIINNDRFQHPEKQKTLIHTIPVISPKVNGRNRSNSSIRLRNSSTTNAELEKLEIQHMKAVESLSLQKRTAKKWMSRQQLRLLCQLESVANERIVVSDLIASEIEEYLLSVNKLSLPSNQRKLVM